MQTLFYRVAGLDIHKNSIVACIRITNKRGQATESVRTFGTMTDDLLALSDWLTEHLRKFSEQSSYHNQFLKLKESSR